MSTGVVSRPLGDGQGIEEGVSSAERKSKRSLGADQHLMLTGGHLCVLVLLYTRYMRAFDIHYDG